MLSNSISESKCQTNSEAVSCPGLLKLLRIYLLVVYSGLHSSEKHVNRLELKEKDRSYEFYKLYFRFDVMRVYSNII